MSNEGSPNRLEFAVEPIPYFVQALVTGLSMLIYVPAAEQLTKLLHYATGKMRFADGTTVSFTGTPALLQPHLLQVTIVIWAQIILNAIIDDPLVQLVVGVAMSLGLAFVSYQVLRVVAPLLVTNHGSRLEFSASVEDYLKWQLIFTGCSAVPALLGLLLPASGFFATIGSITLAVMTLALLGIATVFYMQWFGSKFTGGMRLVRFDANPV